MQYQITLLFKIFCSTIWVKTIDISISPLLLIFLFYVNFKDIVHNWNIDKIQALLKPKKNESQQKTSYKRIIFYLVKSAFKSLCFRNINEADPLCLFNNKY